MRLEAFLHIVDGTLLNVPQISKVSNFSTEAKKIARGDLYIAFDNEIDTAVQNGAYAILSDIDFNINNHEIAWIKVLDLKEAVLKLLRYMLINSEIKFYLMSKSAFLVSKSLFRQNNILHLDNSKNSIRKFFENKQLQFCISCDEELISKVSSSYIQKSQILDSQNFQESLFETKLKEKSFRFSSRLKDEIYTVLEIFKNFRASNNINDTELFRTFYIDNHCNIASKPTQKVVIFDKMIDKNYTTKSKQFLKENFKWLKVGFFNENMDISKIKKKFMQEHLDIIYFEFYKNDVENWSEKFINIKKERGLFVE